MNKSVKNFIMKTPVLRDAASVFLKFTANSRFPGTASYWEAHYKSGGDSGPGSYNRLAEFKAKVINDFIAEKKISSAIEFGCGDGNNLSLIRYPKYIGLDISPTVIQLCIDKFKDDNSRSFYLYNSLSFHDNQMLFRAELSLSLDVIYHLVEDDIFINYMTHVFQSAQRFVIIYSRDYAEKQIYHQKSRDFSRWISENQKSFTLLKKIENPFKYDPKDPDNTSNAVFMIYERADHSGI